MKENLAAFFVLALQSGIKRRLLGFYVVQERFLSKRRWLLWIWLGIISLLSSHFNVWKVTMRLCGNVWFKVAMNEEKSKISFSFLWIRCGSQSHRHCKTKCAIRAGVDHCHWIQIRKCGHSWKRLVKRIDWLNLIMEHALGMKIIFRDVYQDIDLLWNIVFLVGQRGSFRNKDLIADMKLKSDLNVYQFTIVIWVFLLAICFKMRCFWEF